MQINQYAEQANSYHRNEPDNASKAQSRAAPPVRSRRDRSPAQERDKRSAGGPSRPTAAPTANLGTAQRLSLLRTGDEQGEHQATPLRTDSASRAIGLIAVDPATITRAVQQQFRDFHLSVKDLKENLPPGIRQQAGNFIRDRINQAAHIDVDPDETYVNVFDGGEALQDGNDGVTGYQHSRKDLKTSMPLTDFVLQGFSDSWRGAKSDVLNLYYGLYNTNSDDRNYGAHNEVRIVPSDLRKIIGDGDLEHYLSQKQESFWSGNQPQWQALAKAEFSALARKAALDGQLSRQGYELAMKGAAGNVALDDPAHVRQFAADAEPAASAQVHRFDINGYSSTDIVRFSGDTGKQVLYVPGETQPFYEFNAEHELKDWVVKQTQDPVAREELASHFSVADRSKGSWGIFSSTGVAQGLDNLASGKWDRDSIDVGNAAIRTDVFRDMAERFRQREKDDLLQIAGNNDNRQMWLADLARTDSAPYRGPIERALSAGSFAASVGAQGGQAFAAQTASGRRDVKEAAGMNVALTLLFAPPNEASPSIPASRQIASGSTASDWKKQTGFEAIEFPPGSAAEAVNEINDRMQAVTGRNNLTQYASLAELEKASVSADDVTRFKRVRNSLDEVYRRLNASNERLHDRAEKGNVLESLAQSLGIRDERALEEAYERLRGLSSDTLSRFRSLKDNDYSKITFFERKDKSGPLGESERNSPTAAFSNIKDRSRIMLNLEAPDNGRTRLSAAEAANRYNVELVDSIMNHLTRVSANTQDFANVPKEETKDGFALSSASAALRQFTADAPNDAVCRRVLGKEPDFPDDASVRKLLGMSDDRAVNDRMRAVAKQRYGSLSESARKRLGDAASRTYSDQQRRKVAARIREDDMLRADLMTSNADTAALYLRDIGGKRNYDTPPSLDYFLDEVRKKTSDDLNEDGIQELAQKLLALDAKRAPRPFHYYQNGKNTAGYSVEDAWGKLHVFPTESEAIAFRDGKVFWQQVGQKLRNPLGTILESIGMSLGLSPDINKRLFKAGDNPLGHFAALVGKDAGASQDTQEKLKTAGEFAEGAIPVWGPARFYSGLAGRAMEGEMPSTDELQGVVTDMKDMASGVSAAHVGAAPKRPVESPASAAGTRGSANDSARGADKLRDRLRKIQTVGLGGKGAPAVAKKWAAEDRLTAPGVKSGTRDTQPMGGTLPKRLKSSASPREFRPNRGGDALSSTARSFRPFDQQSYASFRRRNAAGVGQGMSLEAIRRLDANPGSRADLLSTVGALRKSLKRSGPAHDALIGSIQRKQNSPELPAFMHYEPQPAKAYRGDRQMSINELENDLRALAPNDAALLAMKIGGKHGDTLDTRHALAVQRLNDRTYQLFDPNNGVFSYSNADSLRNALEPYFDAAYSDKGVMRPDSFTRYKYQRGSAQATDNARRPFGQNHDFPPIDADDIPDVKTITPSAGSLHERDVQIQREKQLHQIADPQSPGYAGHIQKLVSNVRSETGVVSSDLVGLQKIAYEYNTILGVRPVDKFATGLIAAGFETKGYHIKGKSSSWGPQAGLISADQRFSKLENADPARIAHFNAEIEKTIQDHEAIKVPLQLPASRLQTLARLGTISELSAPDSNGVRTFTARAPSGTQYRFEATPQKNAGDGSFVITHEHQPLEVLAPPTPGAKPFTADYDLLVVGPHLSDLGPQDDLPVPDVSHSVFRERVDHYRNGGRTNPELRPAYESPDVFYRNEDPEIGNATQRIRNLIPVINNELALKPAEPHARVVHHNADSGSPATDPAANYPATFALPFKMGRFDEISVVHDANEFKELVQQAKDHGYHVPLNPLWEHDLTGVRRTDFQNARHSASAHPATGAADSAGSDASGVRLTPANIRDMLPGLTPLGLQSALRYLNERRPHEPVAVHNPREIDNATQFFNDGAKLKLLGGGGGAGGAGGSSGVTGVQGSRFDSATGAAQQPVPGTSTASTSASGPQPGTARAKPARISAELKDVIADYIRRHPDENDVSIGRRFGAPRTVVNALRQKLGLKRTTGAGIALTPERRAQIADYIRLHPEETDNQIAFRFDVVGSTIGTIRRDAGLRGPRTFSRLTPERRAEIIAYMREHPELRDDDIARHFHASKTTVNAVRHEAGMRKSGGKGVYLTPQRKAQILDFIRQHPEMSSRDVALHVGASAATIFRLRHHLDGESTDAAAGPSAALPGVSVAVGPSMVRPDVGPMTGPIMGPTASSNPGPAMSPIAGPSTVLPSASPIAGPSTGWESRDPYALPPGYHHQEASVQPAPVSPAHAAIDDEQVIQWMFGHLPPAEIDRITQLPDAEFAEAIVSIRQRME